MKSSSIHSLSLDIDDLNDDLDVLMDGLSPIPTKSKDEPDYGSKDYWEKRYKGVSKSFEWYQSFNAIRNVLSTYVSTRSIVLYAGNLIQTIQQLISKVVVIRILVFNCGNLADLVRI